MSRRTNLDFAVFSIASTDLLGLLKGFPYNVEPKTEDAKALNSRYENTTEVKRGQKFSATLYRNAASGERSCNLDISVFDIGGTHYLGDLEGGKIQVTTIIKEGSGAADRDEVGQACGTNVEVTGKFKIPAGSSATLIRTLGTGSITAPNVTIIITIDTETFSMPMRLTLGSHDVSEEDIQTYNITAKGKGTPTAPSGTGTLLATILTGTAAVAFSVDSGANTYAGNALIESASISFEDAKTTMQDYAFKVQSTPTMAAS